MEQATSFSGWAIVEQMGHKTIVGHVSEQLVAGVPLLRIDVPGLDGSTDPKATQFIHTSTLYALTPTTEAIARKAAARTVTPAVPFGLLPPSGPDVDFDDIDDDDPEDRDRKAVDQLLVDHGLAGVIELLIANYTDVPEPDSDRYTAILEHAKKLVDTDGGWPERTAPAVDEPPFLVGENVPPPLAPSAELTPPPAFTPDANDDGIPF